MWRMKSAENVYRWSPAVLRIKSFLFTSQRLSCRANWPASCQGIRTMLSKFSRINFIKIILVLFLALLQFSGHPSYAANGAKDPASVPTLQPDPAMAVGVLPNGFRYFLLENREPKGRVSMHLNVQAGSMHEEEDQLGAAHFLEHMLFNGSTHFPPGELVKFFQRIGMDFGADANAHTSFFETVYDILLPEGNRKSLAEGLLVMHDYAAGAWLLPEETDQERKVVLAEKRTRDSASYRTFLSSLKFELPEARLSQRVPIGTAEVLESIGAGRLRAFYDTWYRPEKMMLVAVGDFDAEVLAQLVTERFSGLSARAAASAEPDFGKIDHSGIKAFHHYEKESGNTSVGIETVFLVDNAQDSFERRKGFLIQKMADRVLQSRLDALPGKPDTPFTSASIGSGIYLKRVAYGEISARCSPENWKKSLSLLEMHLRNALENGFTASELERVKKEFLAEMDSDVKAASTRSSGKLARRIIRHVNEDRIFQSPEQARDLFAPVVREVTTRVLHEKFKEAWASDHRLLLVTGNADLAAGGASAEEKILSIFGESGKRAVRKPEEKGAEVFPYLPPPEGPGNIAGRTAVSDLGIERVLFENGFVLKMKKTDFKADEILFSLAFGNGISAEPQEAPGLFRLAAAVINESGLGGLEKAALERALAGTNTALEFSLDASRFAIKGASVTAEVPLLFQLLHAFLSDAAVRKEAYLLTMERFGQRYRALEKSVDGAMVLEGERFLAGGDSRFGLPSQERFSQNTLEELRAWAAALLASEPMELSVVGDFDRGAVVDMASRYLGTLKGRKGASAKEDRKPPHFPEGETLTVGVATKIPKGLVTVAWPTGDFYDIERTRRLSVLSEVFSEKLRERIREKLGAAYSPYAYNRSSRAYDGYGVMRAVVSVAPEEAESVTAEVKKIAQEMADGAITEEAVENAVRPLLTGIRDMRRTNGYWLNSVLAGSERHPEQMAWSRSILESYAAITAEELKDLARRYLAIERSATIVVKPEAVR